MSPLPGATSRPRRRTPIYLLPSGTSAKVRTLDGAHVSANVFRRDTRNFADDDVLLDTGVSFPVALSSAHIYGAESQFALPQWGAWSAWFNYSYMAASARLPVVGGLFLGQDASELLNSNARIWISQDQRNTAHGQLRYQPWSRFWTSVGASYGTGLPVELNGESAATLVEEFGRAVVDRVDLNAGRVRPSLSVDLSAALDLYKKESRAVRLQGTFAISTTASTSSTLPAFSPAPRSALLAPSLSASASITDSIADVASHKFTA